MMQHLFVLFIFIILAQSDGEISGTTSSSDNEGRSMSDEQEVTMFSELMSMETIEEQLEYLL